jgi:hydroxyacylglutathione hydrolase
VPGSLSIPLRPVFASQLGWIVPPDRRLLFLLSEEQDRADLVRQSLTIGYEVLVGELDGGIAAWTGAGGPTSAIPVVDPEVIGGTVLDVRQRAEYDAGHLPAAIGIELGDLRDAAVPPGPLTVMCGHGERAATAASILEQEGHTGLAIVAGGPADWAARTGRRLVTGR